MKKLLFLVLCVLNTLGLYAQDEQKSINVTVNSNEQVVTEFDLCDVFVMATRSGNSDVSLSIEVMNNNSFDIFLFGHAFPEKKLKKLKPSIIFDKKSYGTTSKDIITCDGLNDDVLQIEANNKRTLTMNREKAEIVKCELPLYIAKTKNRKKYSIMSRVKITLNVKLIMTEPDADVSVSIKQKYEGIKQIYEDIMESINKVVICTSDKHNPSADQQKKPYKDKIDSLISEISAIKNKNNLMEEDEIYKPYKELITNLNKVKFKTQTCNKCRRPPIPPHHCNYCEMSYESVYKKMESTYKKLDLGKITKSNAVSSVRSIYNAYNGKCPNLKMAIEKSGAKTKINKYYQSIINY